MPGAEQRLSILQRMKDASGVLTAGLALVSVIVSGGAFIVGYFATREQLKTVDCVYKNWTSSLAAQVEQVVLLNTYDLKRSEWKIKKDRLDGKPQNNGLRIEVDEIKRAMDGVFQEITSAQQASKKAIAAKEECLTKGVPIPP